jgi:hypothetical protein
MRTERGRAMLASDAEIIADGSRALAPLRVTARGFDDVEPGP